MYSASCLDLDRLSFLYQTLLVRQYLKAYPIEVCQGFMTGQDPEVRLIESADQGGRII